MPDIIDSAGFACVAFLDTEIYLGSDIHVDSDLGKSMRTRGRIGTDVLVLDDCSVIVGFHVTDNPSVIWVTDCKHGCAVFVV